MIQGIGIDIVELNRIRMILERHPKFIDRILTKTEKSTYFKLATKKRKIEYLAGRFAAKEAFSKAWGTGIGKLRFADIEITNNQTGAPILKTNVLNNEKCFISISHSEQYAIAQVIIESESA
ncbi:holo-[acyl-carrier protein] synthase [Gracilibacillus boraciitolerans JCM 21714]|uniref:Holo-[acyl-carrier-protein] synthase n=1 Tax=Gracilibacillus boraciitolerans JCM 21714 TaxID=1298598 RepID=W4VK82_9BACI|nr:holo-ACP synthase [Gracilibacillus boraciitolerans]GAE93551.1 holo-[acyl-carrier protein] synthase [Gracilibacillus boraciitolerans JCM 21714]